MTWMPCLVRAGDRGGRPVLRLGHPQLDRYLDFVAARARPNTVLATGYDLKVFFAIVAKNPAAVPSPYPPRSQRPIKSRYPHDSSAPDSGGHAGRSTTRSRDGKPLTRNS